MQLQKILKIFKAYSIIIKDIFLNIFFNKKYSLFYIVENANWSIDWDGKYITANLNDQKLLSSKITTTPIGLKNKIIHFGSVNTYININGLKKIHPSNKLILTWFHISPTDKRIAYIPLLNKTIFKVHTSCVLTKNKLIKYGLHRDKIVVIPLGVDLNTFHPTSKKEKGELKEWLGLPTTKLIIGSFQKDGNGWGKGLTPKLIKGPDIFCSIVEKLAKKLPIHILLTGPARGYIKQQLDNLNIPYTHTFLDNYLEIADYYRSLDLYIIASREEGGPKALLEAMSCEIPLISTYVGMSPDILTGTLSELLFTNEIDAYKKAVPLLNDVYFKDKIISSYSRKISNLSWRKIATQYYKLLYKS